MINVEDSDETLMAFYDITTLEPKTLDEVNVLPLDPMDPEHLKTLTIDEQFEVLNTIVKSGDKQYQYYDEDHEDPLRGKGSNVINELLDSHVISSQNDRELNQFLISSREFNSTKFLTTIHRGSSIDRLARSLQFLEKNIQSQNSELKGVIDENYLQFVECKKSIDDVLLAFRNQKTRAQKEMEKIRVFNPQRHKVEKDNTLLIGELEESIKNLTLSTSVMIRPIMETKTRGQKIQRLADFIKNHKFLFDLPNILLKNVVNKEHDQILEDYHRYLKEKNELLEEQAFRREEVNKKDETTLKSTVQDYQIINSALSRVFREVEGIIMQYRKITYQELVSIDHEVVNKRLKTITNDKFLSLVDKIYRLDNTDPSGKILPVAKFLQVQLTNARKDFEYQMNKFDDKFETMQKKLIDYTVSLSDHRESGSNVKSISEKYKHIEESFMASTSTKSLSFEELEGLVSDVFGSSDNLDLSIINETWLVLLNFVSYLKETFLPNINKLSNNYTHYYKMNKEVDSKGEIRGDFEDLVLSCVAKLHGIFSETDENGSVNQLESSPLNYSKFLPYYTNSLSAVFYLTRISKKINLILTVIGRNIAAIGNAHKSTETNKLVKQLRTVSGSINQKILEATCSVWVNDCSQFYDLETLEVDEGLFEDSAGGATFTKLMNVIEFYDTYILRKIKDLVFIKDLETSDSDQVKIVSMFPSKRMLVSIEIQFMRSLNIIVDSVMKKYNIEMQKEADSAQESNETFKVLIMNNLERIAKTIYPRLIVNFDKKFEKDLSKQKLKLFSDIDKVNLTIFDDIISKEKFTVDEILNRFFTRLENNSLTIAEVKIDNYVYEVLVHFVKLVYNIKPLTNAEIFVNIINELQKFTVQGILDYFRKVRTTLVNYNILLINLKLDVSFFVEVFESSTKLKINNYCFGIVDIILKSLGDQEKQFDTSFFSNKKFDSYLVNALKDSASQFDCLSR